MGWGGGRGGGSRPTRKHLLHVVPDGGLAQREAGGVVPVVGGGALRGEGVRVQLQAGHMLGQLPVQKVGDAPHRLTRGILPSQREPLVAANQMSQLIIGVSSDKDAEPLWGDLLITILEASTTCRCRSHVTNDYVSVSSGKKAHSLLGKVVFPNLDRGLGGKCSSAARGQAVVVLAQTVLKAVCNYAPGFLYDLNQADGQVRENKMGEGEGD